MFFEGVKRPEVDCSQGIGGKSNEKAGPQHGSVCGADREMLVRSRVPDDPSTGSGKERLQETPNPPTSRALHIEMHSVHRDELLLHRAQARRLHESLLCHTWLPAGGMVDFLLSWQCGNQGKIYNDIMRG